jgi:hypothetical protein
VPTATSCTVCSPRTRSSCVSSSSVQFRTV